MSNLSISIAKSGLKSAVIEAIYNEILSNSNNYYYFLGRTLQWGEGDEQEDPQVDSQYESAVRSEIIFLKKVTSADVAYIIPRYDWSSGQVFDMYDDQIGRTKPATGASWAAGVSFIDCANHGFLEGDTVSVSGVVPTGYNGKFTVTYAESNRFGFVTAENPGTFSTPGTVTRCSTLGFETLEESKFYCMTTDYHVYKCLDNNGGAASTIKPYSTTQARLKLSDGYVWKYMYTVPVSSRNKFMSPTDIPVTTAIRAPFYSRGRINSVTVSAYGENYTPATTQLRVYGNGYLEDNPIRITGAYVTSEGSGYSEDPNVTVQDPFESDPFTTNTTVLPGVYLKAGNNIYLTMSGGTTGQTSPTHTGSDLVYNGSVALKYVGTATVAQIERTGDKITDVSLLGIIGYINITNPGYGYETAPNVLISGDGVGAQASCSVVGTRVSNADISNRGTDYTSATVSFDAPMSYDDTWGSEDTVALDDILYHNGNFYKVTNVDEGTTLGTIPPVHTFGSLMNGDVELTFVGATAEATVDVYYGYGYSTTPIITIDPPIITGTIDWESEGTVALNDIIQYSDNFYEVTNVDEGTTLGANPPSHTDGAELNGDVELTFVASSARLSLSTEKTEAKIAPVIENGQITSVIVVDGGIGYTTATIIAITFGSGVGAVLSPNLSYGDLNTNQANIELLAVPGTIDAIKVTDPGSGYNTSNATVTIEGDGTGAEATATIDNGKLTKVTVTNNGSGYSYANIVISSPTEEEGIQATARAIVSPYDGHGKNAVLELGASDVSLFSSIAGEINQGFTVLNDYRQIGILKNPQQFGNSKRYNFVLGSTCYGTTLSYPGNDGSNITLDSVLTDSNGNRFRVVARETGSNSCSLLLQSIDNAGLSETQNLFYGLDTLTITTILEPTVNKYSGNLLFIDNRNAFTPNVEQTIAMRTAIRF